MLARSQLGDHESWKRGTGGSFRPGSFAQDRCGESPTRRKARAIARRRPPLISLLEARTGTRRSACACASRRLAIRKNLIARDRKRSGTFTAEVGHRLNPCSREPETY